MSEFTLAFRLIAAANWILGRVHKAFEVVETGPMVMVMIVYIYYYSHL